MSERREPGIPASSERGPSGPARRAKSGRSMSALRFDVGAVRLTRISYAEVGVPPEVVGLTPEQVASVEWGEPLWVGGGEVKAAAAVWIIESGDARIAVDPAQAADDILRSEADAGAHQTAFAALLAAAGFPRESITHAIATHAEGVGMWAWRTDDGAWVPFFPNADDPRRPARARRHRRRHPSVGRRRAVRAAARAGRGASDHRAT